MKFKYKIVPTPTGYEARVMVPLTKTQSLVFVGTAKIADTRSAMMEAQVSGLFGDIGKGLKKLTKSKALRNSVGAAIKVLDNPAVKATLMAVNPGLGVGVMTGVQALKAGEQLINKATKAPKGSPERIKARAAIKIAQNVAALDEKQLAELRKQLPPGAEKACKYINMVTAPKG